MPYCCVLLRGRQDEETQYRGLDPLLLLDTQRRLEVVRWHPSNDNLFAAVAASDRSVYLYDAQYTQVQACLLLLFLRSLLCIW